ncbi:pirin family protein [Alteromonas pelagimontana]|uniref:Pirin family protein n=1 Tax=Alteromonas pelagimontana TaxID=1858656 RepID=A0A6M4MIQ9_9ALTE|nr:pirin family protein [Alteromonas pelagimontana]QJR82515.1 pirin family protein [Alteromonas pelagimontana]
MTTRTVTGVYEGMATQDGAGVSLTRIIGQPAIKRLDPFLMLDFFSSDKPGEYIAGFPPHPHRGFQTVTYMLAGKMRHRDSVGNEGLIQSGGIQWMNAGRGLIHEEMPEQEEGLLQGFQLWVNLPASQKMSAPGYQDIQPDAVPHVSLTDKTIVKVLAGNLEGQAGPVQTNSVKPLFTDFIVSERDKFDVTLPADHTAFVYCYEGGVEIAEKPVEQGQLAVLSAGDFFSVKAEKAAKFILVAGAPLREPVVQYGPFVMNTDEEIQQALQDYQSGKLAN